MVKYCLVFFLSAILVENNLVLAQKFEYKLSGYDLSKYEQEDLKNLIQAGLEEALKEKPNDCFQDLIKIEKIFIADISYSQVSYENKGQVVTDTLIDKWIPKTIYKHKIYLKSEKEIQKNADKNIPEKGLLFLRLSSIKIDEDTAQISIGQSCKFSKKSKKNMVRMYGCGDDLLFTKINGKWIYFKTSSWWVE